MKVLVNAVLGRAMGGAVRHLTPFLEALRRLHPNDEFHCVGNRPSGPPTAIKQFLWHQRGVNEAARAINADAILSLLNFGPIRPARPHVLLQRNPTFYHPALRTSASLVKRTLTHLVMRRAARIVAPSHAMRDMILETHADLDPEKVRVVWHGVDRTWFYPPERRNPPGYRLQVLFVGPPTPWKGLEVFRKACQGLPVRTFEALVVKQYGMPARYRWADILAYPSWGESFGFPMVEAMASGVPVVAADVPVNREILGGMDGECALFYAPPESADRLRWRLAELIGDADLRAEMSQRGLERSKQFSWERCAQETMAILREVVT